MPTAPWLVLAFWAPAWKPPEPPDPASASAGEAVARATSATATLSSLAFIPFDSFVGVRTTAARRADGALRRPVKEAQPGCQTASTTRLGLRKADRGRRRVRNGNLANTRAAASAATRSGASWPCPPDWAGAVRSWLGPGGAGGSGLGGSTAPAGAAPDERPRSELRSLDGSPAGAAARGVMRAAARGAAPAAVGVTLATRALPAAAGAAGDGVASEIGACVRGGDSSTAGPTETITGTGGRAPSDVITGATALLTISAGAGAGGTAGGAGGGPAGAGWGGGAGACGCGAAAVAAPAIANAWLTAGRTAAPAPGATASTCASADSTCACASASPGGELAARARAGPASAPQTAAASTHIQRENGLATRIAAGIVQPLIAPPTPGPTGRRWTRRRAGGR